MRDKSHTLVTASRVRGAVVYNAEGNSIGHVHDLSIEKGTGRVRHALVSFGGLLGIGDRYHAIDWSAMHYDSAMDGYIIPLDREDVEAMPSYTHDELVVFGHAEPLFAHH